MSKSAAPPFHIAIVMDGNGRWATQRGLPRIEGHKRGESVMIDVAAYKGVDVLPDSYRILPEDLQGALAASAELLQENG